VARERSSGCAGSGSSRIARSCCAAEIAIVCFQRPLDDAIRIPSAADAAVVTREPLDEIPVLHVQVVLQNVRTEQHIDVGLEQVVLVLVAELRHPKRHDLHQTQSARRGNRESVEVAFDVDDRQHELGRDPGPGCLLMNCHQDLDAFIRIGHLAGKTPRHIGQPDLGVETIFEAVWFGDCGQQNLAQAWVRAGPRVGRHSLSLHRLSAEAVGSQQQGR